MPRASSVPPIVQRDAPVLHITAAAIAPDVFGTKKLHETIQSMQAALVREDDGVAIAAPQIGVSERIFCVSPHAYRLSLEGEVLPEEAAPAEQPLVFINPRIISSSKKTRWVPEGCLSVRWAYGEAKRHEKVTVEAYDETGTPFLFGAEGLLAQIMQHEIDHLDGILFIDHARLVEELPPETITKIEERARERRTQATPKTTLPS